MPKSSSFTVPDTIILAGGKGTRLAKVVPTVPKVIVPVAGKPFIRHLIHYLSVIGIRHIVFSLGYLSQQVIDCIRSTKFSDMIFDFAIEDTPLGTGGGIRFALDQTRTDPILVLNGDTYCQFDLSALIDFHLKKKAKISLVSSKVSDASRYGTLKIEPDQKVSAFLEKNSKHSSVYVNAGVYLVSRDVFSKIPKGNPFSFEKDFLPKQCGNGLYAYPDENQFIDIGTPESYREAGEFFSHISGKLLKS